MLLITKIPAGIPLVLIAKIIDLNQSVPKEVEEERSNLEKIFPQIKLVEYGRRGICACASEYVVGEIESFWRRGSGHEVAGGQWI